MTTNCFALEEMQSIRYGSIIAVSLLDIRVTSGQMRC